MWRCRPSDILRIEDPYEGYCLDQAVGAFGSSVEAEMDKAEQAASKGKGSSEQAVERAKKQVLERFGITGNGQGEQQFADPVAFM